MYGFNPLERWPIVVTQRSGMVVPIPPLLIDRVTIGLYHDLLAAHGEDFTRAFGHAFEDYVGTILGSVYDRATLHGEVPYGRDALSTDWIVTDGPGATLLECKATRLRLDTKVSADPAALRIDLAKGVAKALVQLHRVLRDIRAGVRGLEQFRNREPLVPVVLLLDPFHTANSNAIRNLVGEELRSRDIGPFEYQVVSIDEIEAWLPTIKQRGLTELLCAKMADRGNPINSMAYADFDTYLRHVAGESEERKLAEPLEDEWLAFKTYVESTFPELRSATADNGSGAPGER